MSFYIMKSFLISVFIINLTAQRTYANSEADNNIDCTPNQAQASCQDITNINDCIRRHSPQVNVDEDKGLVSIVTSWLGIGYAGINCGECGTFIKKCVSTTEDLRFYFPNNKAETEEP